VWTGRREELASRDEVALFESKRENGTRAAGGVGSRSPAAGRGAGYMGSQVPRGLVVEVKKVE
jgi:hypothetical protein